MKEEKQFPFSLSQPAQRALANAGIASLEHCAKLGKAQLSKLHGMGPNALGKIEEALKVKGIKFS